MRRLVGNQQGFSLIEVLAAMTILSIISVSLMAYFLQGLDMTKDQHQRVIASHFAKKKMDELREHFLNNDNYDKLYDYMSTLSEPMIVFNDHQTVKNHGTIADLTSIEFKAVMEDCLDLVMLDSTPYQYLLEVDKRLEMDIDGDGVNELTRMGQLNQMSSSDTSSRIIKATLTVYWSPTENLTPAAKDRISMEFYLNER
jgi:prepilin-type N-terminal cleavage/methylation domain-containing protein